MGFSGSSFKKLQHPPWSARRRFEVNCLLASQLNKQPGEMDHEKMDPAHVENLEDHGASGEAKAENEGEVKAENEGEPQVSEGDNAVMEKRVNTP